MTLEGLIDHEEKESKATWNGKPTLCAEEHRQLAEWLKDYKRLLEQERKIGKWITVNKGLMVTSYKCSECGRIVKDDTGYDVIKDYPFCHCGVKMSEVINNG